MFQMGDGGIFFAADKTDLSGRKGTVHGNLHKGSLFQLFPDKFPDHTRHPHTDLCKTDQQIHGSDLQDMGKLDLPFLQERIDRLAGDIVFIQKHKRGGLE